MPPVNPYDEAPKDLKGTGQINGPTAVGQQGAFGGDAGIVAPVTDPNRVREDYNAGVVNANQEQVGANSAERNVDRYRSLAGDSQGRQAYQLQFGKALGNEKQATDLRNTNEMESLRMLRGAAQGNAPSRAEIEGGQVAGDSLEGVLRAGAGARGGGTAVGQARGQANPFQAMVAQQGTQLGGTAGAAGARSGEMNSAMGSYGAGAGLIRGQDAQGQNLAQKRAEAQSQSEMAQRRLNDSRQQGFERDAFNVRKAQQGGVLSM
jgi:hypothetical protein